MQRVAESGSRDSAGWDSPISVAEIATPTHSVGGHTGGIVRKKSVGTILLTEIIHPPAGQLPVHSHRNACFTLVLSGGFEESFGRDFFLCQKETLLYRPSEARHSDKFSPEGARALLIEPEESWVESLGDDGRLLKCPRHIGRSPATTLALHLRRELEYPDDLSNLVVEGLALQVAGQFQRCHRQERSHRIPAWLAHARQRLDELSMPPPTISALAASADVHPAHLAREFRRFFRCTPGTYVRQVRVAAACRILAETELPMIEVAYRTGFSNQSHFSRTFRSIMTMTPSQYRTSTNAK